MYAFENAVDLGFRYLETDVHLTSDGVLVLFHDDDVSRVSGEPGKVSDLSLAQIQQLRVGGAEPIPTLDELLGPTLRSKSTSI